MLSYLARRIGALRPFRSRLSLRTHLLAVVLVALVPMVIFAVEVVLTLWSHQRNEVHKGVQETARALAIAVDRELASFVSTLQALAQSPLLDDDNLIDFHEECQRVLPTQREWRTIRLVEPSGAQLLNAMTPYGQQLPSVGEHEYLHHVVETRRPAISNLSIGAVSGLPMVDVAVPVVRQEHLRYVLVAGLSPGTFDDILRAQGIRADGIAGIFDATDRFVARSRDSDQYIGLLPIEPLLSLMQVAPEGVARLPVHDSPGDTYSAWSRLPSSRWTVSVGIPAEPIEAVLTRGLAMLALSGLGLLLLGAVLATLLARGVASSIGKAAAAAVELARGRPLPPVRSKVAEVTRLVAALEEAGVLLQRESAQRQRAEEELARLLASEQQARARAEAANRAKDEFLAMLGHELRNPLAAISNAVHLLEHLGERSGGPGDRSVRARQVIARQTKHLARLMDDLLDVGRVVTGKIMLDRQPMDLAEAVRHAVATLGAAGRASQHQLTTTLEPAWIDGDPTRIDQVIGNLVTNALKYTPPEGDIRVTVRNEQGWAVLEVQDSGIGIAPHLLPRVFELFVQGECTLERSQGGLGIGLTLVRQLVELHGGTVDAASEGPGQGTAFTVRLPARAPRPGATAQAPCEAAAHTPGGLAGEGPAGLS